MKEFFKAFLSFGLATSIQKLLGFIILPIYTRYFDKTEYGIIDMVGTILSVAIIFGVLQLETSLQRYYYVNEGLKRKLLVSNIYILIGTASISIAVVLFTFAPSISRLLFEDNMYANLIRLVSVQLPFNNLSMLGLVILRFEKKNLNFLRVIIVNVVFSLLFVYLFVIHWRLGLPGVFYAQLGAMVLSSLLATYYIRYLLIFRWSRQISIRNIKYALPQFPARVGSMVLGQANRFFMLGYLGLGAIGIYSVSLKLASTIQLVNTAFILAWAPFMFEQFKNKNNKEVFARAFPLVVGAAFLAVSLITLVSKEMVMLLTTEEYYSAHKYVGGLALFFSLYIIKETVDIGPKIREKTKYLSYIFFISVIVNIVSLYLFVQVFQISGVVFSMILTNLVLVSLSWFVSNRLYYIPFSLLHFVFMLAPVILLVIISIIYPLTLLTRGIIALVVCSYYGILLIHHFKKFREVDVEMKNTKMDNP